MDDFQGTALAWTPGQVPRSESEEIVSCTRSVKRRIERRRTCRCIIAGDAVALPADAIHSVTNPLSRFTGGIHVCGGDFFATARSQWNPETLGEEPSDGETIRGIFRRENERMRRCEAL